MSQKSVAVQQIARPDGAASAEHFETVTLTLPEVTEGTALVENRYLSIDPYHRQLMDADGWDLHAPLEGRTIGRVIESRAPGLSAGDLVFHRQGWRSHAIVAEADVRLLPTADSVATSHFLSILGGTGLTAYVGLTQIARLQPGETIFISSAAGGVGTAAGQFAKVLGADTVIGSAGSAAKVAHLVDDLGFDAAFNYRDGDITKQLRDVAGEGIHVYFDNVGAEHLEAAIDVMRDNGRIAACGMISQYNGGPAATAPGNLTDIVEKAIRFEGFLVRDYRHLQEQFEQWAIPHLASGAIVADETLVDGLDNIVEAFVTMLSGGSTGKVIIRA